MIVGNDISGYQGDVDYPLYKNNTNFVIIKVSEGVGFKDSKFLRNQQEARNQGIPLGYYHLVRPDLGNVPENEAEWFLKAIGELREGEVLCLDNEPGAYNASVDYCKRFLDRIFQKTGVRALIYLNQSQVRNANWKPVVDGGYALWLAAYIPTDQAFTGQWGSMAMQQWTSKQHVPGILGGTGNVDGDWFFGTVEQFKKYGYHKPEQSSDSPSQSPSKSPSASNSPSPSASPSPSVSPSSSASPSPSASPEIPGGDCEEKLARIAAVLKSPWWWVGSNAWYNKRSELKKILYESNV